MTLQTQGYLGLSILVLYLFATILIGWISRRQHTRANDFLNASRSLPLWIIVSAFLSANCGALEIVGLSAVAAQYGVQAFHFYWVGAIPGMVFLSAVMIPIYMRSGVHSLPEYLESRFDARIRLINAWLILIIGTALAGIGVYAMAQVLRVVFGWPFSASTLLAATAVLIYVALGGLRATIYNEVLQLLIIAAGLLPLLFRTSVILHSPAAMSGPHWHLWRDLPVFSPHGAILDQFGVIAGLSFVLSFSYWCTDFVQIQRALTAKTVASGRMVPLLAGFGKLGFSILVVVPVLGASLHRAGPMAHSFDQTLPALMVASYGPILLGLGMTALLASLMTGLAANVSAFSAVWTAEIYRPYLRPAKSESHYIAVGRVSIVVAVALSILTSYLAFYFHNLMEYVQLIFSLFAAPFFAVFLLGIFTRRATPRGAIAGLFSGVALALLHHGMIALGWLRYGSLMSANFYVAIYAFCITICAGLWFSRPAKQRDSEQKDEARLERLVFDWRSNPIAQLGPLWWALAGALLAACGVLNYLWR